ncbi:MAG: hypothetical protein IPG90_07060 [Bacteroidetes bacterium]|nr:hypothetical protein [Bacteroidota bacterium]
MKGYSIGKNVGLSLGCVVIGKDVVLGDHCKIGFFSIIRGRSIRIDRFARIGSMSVIDTERIEIGEDARINEQVYVGGNEDAPIRIDCWQTCDHYAINLYQSHITGGNW